MKLWLVLCYWIEDVNVVGVFSSKEKADATVPKEPQPYYTYEVTEITLDEVLYK